MAPVRDPIRNIVYSAQSEDLESVVIDGRWVMRERKIPGFEPRELARNLQAGAEALWRDIGEGDWAHRNIDQLSPASFPPFEP
jgi:5-methylthioadenosine/S-adenosylhomocysteine deaminase